MRFDRFHLSMKKRKVALKEKKNFSFIESLKCFYVLISINFLILKLELCLSL